MKILNKSKIFRLLSLTLVLCLAFLLLPTRAYALDDPEMLPEAVLLVEQETGKILYEKNADVPRAPASLTKIMTVMLIIEACESGEINLTDTVTVGSDVYFDISSDGSTADLTAGEELTVEDLLYCAMLPSANEACNVLAEYLCGDVATFIDRMNERARELQCANTVFANTHGMPNDEHHSCARDIMTITLCALEKPVFRELAAATEYTVPATNRSPERKLQTSNQLMRSQSTYYYPYASGVKTGTTNAAGYCLVSTATKDGLTLVSVVMGARSVILENGTTQVQSFSETKRLFEWAFDNFSYQNVITTMNLIREVPVELGKTGSVVLRPSQGISDLLPNDTDVTQARLKVYIKSELEGKALYAPISQGEELGWMSVELNGVEYGDVPLVANTAVELDRVAYIGHQISRTLSNTFVKLTIILLGVFLAGYIAYIVVYTVNRKRRREAADALARKRIAELRQNAEARSTVGMTFEEIEALHTKD